MDHSPAVSIGHTGPSQPRVDSSSTPPSIPTPQGSPPRSAASRPRRKPTTNVSLSFSFPPVFQPNTSSTSLIPSTAEGKPIPLDNATAASRTSALRTISTNYPSRHRYAKSTGAQSTTYAQPVLVRTYSGSPSRQSSTTRSVGGERRITRPAGGSSVTSGPAASVRRIIALRTPFGGKEQSLLSMARAKAKKGGGRHDFDAPAKLPPIEAYSFKSMMSGLDAQGEDNTINADLDRIAEICARSRYSLSNQYEVHVAPHGSGAAFLASASSKRHQRPSGPTLQAVGSDDEQSARRHRKRRSGGGRRKSVAVGTLETIMSSSGSSEDGKSKKKSASELADEIRGRAARVLLHQAESPDGTQPQSNNRTTQARSLTKKKSSALATAMMESARQHAATDVASPRSSAATLVSEPALPHTSTSHLEVRTEPERRQSDTQLKQEDSVVQNPENVRNGPLNPEGSHEQSSQDTLLGGLKGWMPTWSFPPALGLSPTSASGDKNPSHAEGSLRHLLQTGHSKSKGKGVDRSF